MFEPEDVPGARVLTDGTLMVNGKLVEHGEIAKSATGEAYVHGTVVDPTTKTVFRTEGFDISIGMDKYLVRKKVRIQSAKGVFDIESKRDFQVMFYEDHPLITGKEVTIEPMERENTIILEKGYVVLYDGERYGLAPHTTVNFGDKQIGDESDVFLTRNTFTVEDPTTLCFTECRGIDKILPNDYKDNTIEVLRERKFGNNQPLNRLKITTVTKNGIITDLQNSQYESIYADAHSNGIIIIKQHGTTVALDKTKATGKDAGYDTQSYYSEAVVVGGDVKVKGQGTLPIGGSFLLVPSNDIAFNEKSIITKGDIKIVYFDEEKGKIEINSEILNGFNLDEYHHGGSINEMINLNFGGKSMNDYLFGLDVPKTVEGYANAIREYAQDNGISVEEAYKIALREYPGWISWDFKIDNRAQDLMDALGFDEETSKKLIQDVVVEKIKEDVKEGRSYTFDTVDAAFKFEGLDQNTKDNIIESAFKDYLNGELNSGGVDLYERLNDHKNDISSQQYDQTMRGIVDRYKAEGRISDAIYAMETSTDKQGNSLYTQQEIDAMKQEREALRNRPVRIVSDDDVSNYRNADRNNDDLIEPGEANYYNHIMFRDQEVVLPGPYVIE